VGHLHDGLVEGADRVALLPEVFGDQVFLGIESYTEQALLVADGGEEVGAGHGTKIR
jgi:hypothetical protein